MNNNVTLQDLGKVGYLSKGTYDRNIEYELSDVVTYQGSSYVSKINENKDNTPSKNSEYWQLLVEKPIVGIDYFNDDDKRQMVDDLIEGVDSQFNEYINDKKIEVNSYVNDKKVEFDGHVNDKKVEFDDHAKDKVDEIFDLVMKKTVDTDVNEFITQKFDDGELALDLNYNEETEELSIIYTDNAINNLVEEINGEVIE